MAEQGGGGKIRRHREHQNRIRIRRMALRPTLSGHTKTHRIHPINFRRDAASRVSPLDQLPIKTCHPERSEGSAVRKAQLHRNRQLPTCYPSQLMSPIITSLLLGLTAAGANVFGGAIIVQKNWDRSYLRYFVALGAGFMLATALVDMVPER